MTNFKYINVCDGKTFAEKFDVTGNINPFG